MKYRKRALALAVLVWIVPFLIGLISYPVRELWRALYESIMALSLTAIVVVCSSIYFMRIEENHLREGFGIGLLWLATNLLLDTPFFLLSQWPIPMGLRDYLADIGLTYVMIPTITVGFGAALEHFHLHGK